MSGTCDFCSARTGPDKKSYKAKSIIALEAGPQLYMDSGEWVACVDCAVMIDHQEWKALIGRAKLLNPGLRAAAQQGRLTGKELQVSVTGAVAIESGCYPFCNPCGFAMHKSLIEAGVGIDAMISPEARAKAREILERLVSER